MSNRVQADDSADQDASMIRSLAILLLSALTASGDLLPTAVNGGLGPSPRP